MDAARLVPGCDLKVSGSREQRAANGWFNKACFTPVDTASEMRFGNEPRNIDSVRMDHMNNWDFSISKRNDITERVYLQFTAEFFNAFNHVRFGAPDKNVGSLPTALNGHFGVVTSQANPPRAIQFGCGSGSNAQRHRPVTGGALSLWPRIILNVNQERAHSMSKHRLLSFFLRVQFASLPLVALSVLPQDTHYRRAAQSGRAQRTAPLISPLNRRRFSTFLSPEAKAYLTQHLKDMQDPEILKQDAGVPRFMKPYIARAREFLLSTGKTKKLAACTCTTTRRNAESRRRTKTEY